MVQPHWPIASPGRFSDWKWSIQVDSAKKGYQVSKNYEKRILDSIEKIVSIIWIGLVDWLD